MFLFHYHSFISVFRVWLAKYMTENGHGNVRLLCIIREIFCKTHVWRRRWSCKNISFYTFIFVFMYRLIASRKNERNGLESFKCDGRIPQVHTLPIATLNGNCSTNNVHVSTFMCVCARMSVCVCVVCAIQNYTSWMVLETYKDIERQFFTTDIRIDYR